METEYEVELFNKHFEVFDSMEDNCEVYVTLKSGSKYVATVFTVKGIEKVMQTYRETGECAEGSYFWCSDLLILSIINESCIKKAVASLMHDGEFDSVFTVCDTVGDDGDGY